MKTVAVIDYGMGNLRSVMQAVQHAAVDMDVQVVVTASPHEMVRADRIILPGQGAMVDCMNSFNGSGLRESLMKAIKEKPLFGVCVGMQMLLDGSEEGAPIGDLTPALGLLPGRVQRFDLAGQFQADGSRYKVPQMGWNQVRQTQPHALWQGIPDASWFYFVHSYYACLSQWDTCVGTTEYGSTFASVIARDNIFATQFHPEKSAQMGLQLYRNFLHWTP